MPHAPSTAAGSAGANNRLHSCLHRRKPTSKRLPGVAKYHSWGLRRGAADVGTWLNGKDARAGGRIDTLKWPAEFAGDFAIRLSLPSALSCPTGNATGHG